VELDKLINSFVEMKMSNILLGKKYVAHNVFYENEVNLEVILPESFDNENDAEKYANLPWGLYLLPTGKIGRSHLVLMLADRSFVVPRDNFKIYIDENFYNRRKLDPKDPDDYATIMGALDDPNSPYVITKDDLTLVDWDIEKLAEVVGCPMKFDSLAWGVEEVSDD
jgi:hypothetical protein